MVDDDWWAGPWDCQDCTFVAYNYADAEHHRDRYDHTLVNRRGPAYER